MKQYEVMPYPCINKELEMEYHHVHMLNCRPVCECYRIEPKFEYPVYPGFPREF